MYPFCPGSQTSMSYVLAEENPISPVHSTTVRYGSPSRCRMSSASRRQLLQLVVALFRPREFHQLHLLKLMLPDDAAHVAPVRARLAAEARRVGAERDRQRVGVQRLVAIQIRHRNLGRRRQPDNRCLSHLEQILLELRQLPGAVEARRVDHERRQHFGIAVLARVHVEHEVDQRALQLRAQAPVHREPRAGDLGRALQIEDAELRPQVPVRLWVRNRTRAACPSGAPRRCPFGCLPTGTDSCGIFGMPASSCAELLVERLDLLVERGDPVADVADLLLPLRGVCAFALQFADLAAGSRCVCAFSCSASVTAPRRSTSSSRNASTSSVNPRVGQTFARSCRDWFETIRDRTLPSPALTLRLGAYPLGAIGTHFCPTGCARVLRARPDQPVVAVLLQNVRRPAGHAADRENRREQIDRNAQRIVRRRRVEIDVGVQALLLLDGLSRSRCEVWYRSWCPVRLPSSSDSRFKWVARGSTVW